MDTHTLVSTPPTEAVALRRTIADLGFKPVMLDYSTMTVYSSFDGLGGPPRLTLMAGFERKGFFFTRAAAEQAAREWVEA